MSGLESQLFAISLLHTGGRRIACNQCYWKQTVSDELLMYRVAFGKSISSISKKWEPPFFRFGTPIFSWVERVSMHESVFLIVHSQSESSRLHVRESSMGVLMMIVSDIWADLRVVSLYISQSIPCVHFSSCKCALRQDSAVFRGFSHQPRKNAHNSLQKPRCWTICGFKQKWFVLKIEYLHVIYEPVQIDSRAPFNPHIITNVCGKRVLSPPE